MSAKRWFVTAVIAALAVAALVAALNVLADPFGVFGDKLFNWYSYDMTNNPKTAKYAYIDEHTGTYDAFIIGPSGSSGFSTATLEKYTGLRWYNMFNYGADMAYTEKLAEYLVKTQHPKHILLCVPVISASLYDTPVTDITYDQPLKTLWRLPFLFANPKFSAQKIEDFRNKSYLQESFDVFNAETGTYDKSTRDAEAIGSIDAYLAAYPEFADPPTWHIPFSYTDQNIAAIVRIKDLCQQYGVKLTVATCPMLTSDKTDYDPGDIENYFTKLAGVTDFWDFSISSVSDDPRYFYDTTHFRNCVGDMMLARMFGDTSVYVPGDLGVYVTPENALAAAAGFESGGAADPAAYTCGVPVLMYHDIPADGDPSSTVTAAAFAAQMKALYDAGYTAVSLDDIQNYVLKGAPLPAKPVVITFDDGYLSDYQNAFPVLEQYGFHATIFIIGVSFGETETYKDTGMPITPHFGMAEAREMVQSGLISIQSHSFDMHQVEPYDQNPRSGVLRRKSESEQDYVDAFRTDYGKNSELIKSITGEDVFAFAYPYGLHDTFSSVLLRQLGATMTFITDPGLNTLVKGMPQSLYELKRFAPSGETSGEDIIKMISPDNSDSAPPSPLNY